MIIFVFVLILNIFYIIVIFIIDIYILNPATII